ncbi:MAG TPA: TlpA family protein disulfide reductase [Candidatus Dormibacteraeota bacterium]|nr:TlpA family protein disulfide reductase [Candidatus Dormibacteraeota bacterium]
MTLGILVVAALWAIPRLQAPTGSLLIVGAGRTAGSLPATALSLERDDGSWIAAGDVLGSVPAAPQQRELLLLAFPVGTYEHIRFRGDVERATVTVTAGQVEPLLLGIEAGNLIPGAVYAGNDAVNLGLGELAGTFVPMSQFDLVDQNLRGFTSFATAGKDVVIAAFHTTCHETCPLYTALFFQLAKHLPANVTLAEVTTDPTTDTPAVLLDYKTRYGATWEFATGTPDQVASFWKPFGVDLAAGDSHTSTLVLVDRHGYIRLVYRGVPNVGGGMPANLVTSLSAEGLAELAGGGDGWGATDVLQALLTIAGPEQSSQSSGGKAPSFALPSTAGGTVTLAGLAGQPLVINFWRSDCPPCKAEMPLLQQQVDAHPGARLVLINWGETSQVVRTFLGGLGINGAALLDGDLSVGRAYGITGLPTTVFVRADGTIDRRQVGQLDERVLASELSNLGSQ